MASEKPAMKNTLSCGFLKSKQISLDFASAEFLPSEWQFLLQSVQGLTNLELF